MKNNKCDILNLEWVSDGRDTHIVEPVLVSLEKRYGYRIIRSSIWAATIKILWYRPKVIIMSNDIGAENNVKVFHFANLLGVHTISLISEGLIQNIKDKQVDKEIIEAFFWGNNYQHELFWDLKLIWSKTLLKKFYEWIPHEYIKNVYVCGATGFDRYKLFSGLKCSELREEIRNGREKIVLLVGYPFDQVQRIIKNDEILDQFYSGQYQQLDSLREVYYTIVKKNPQIQFVLKYHPAVSDKTVSEFYGLDVFDNTISFTRDVEISKLIEISDMVIGFESTVAMEAWLMDKYTVFVNPLGVDFNREETYKGVKIVKTAEELQNVINSYYAGNVDAEYDEKRTNREAILERSIQYCDGLNYLRSSKTIDDYISNSMIKKKNIRIKDVLDVCYNVIHDIMVLVIEYTVLGVFFPKHRQFYKSRSKVYNKSIRNSVSDQYCLAIEKYECEHAKEVRSIINDFSVL